MHEIEDFPYHCGSRIFCGFYFGSTSYYEDYFPKDTANTAFAIFTNREDQRDAYDALKKRFKILYQSPILQPKHNSQNPYFIVIYLNKKP